MKGIANKFTYTRATFIHAYKYLYSILYLDAMPIVNTI